MLSDNSLNEEKKFLVVAINRYTGKSGKIDSADTKQKADELQADWQKKLTNHDVVVEKTK